MTDNAVQTAHNPAAPQDERQDALRQAQQEALPSTVDNMLPLVQYVQQRYQEEQMQKNDPGAENAAIEAESEKPAAFVIAED